MGHKARARRVRLEVDLRLVGHAEVVVDERVARTIELRIAKGKTAGVREFGLEVDWAEVARSRAGGEVLGCEELGPLS